MDSPRYTQLAPAVPGARHDFVLGVADFNHRQELPASTLLKYASDARWVAFATWPALARMLQEDSGADVLVKAQLIRFLRPSKCTPASVLGISQVRWGLNKTTFRNSTNRPYSCRHPTLLGKRP